MRIQRTCNMLLLYMCTRCTCIYVYTHMLSSVYMSVWDIVVSCSCIFKYTSDIVRSLECRPYTHIVTHASIYNVAILVTTEVNFLHSPLNIFGSTFVCTWVAFTSHRVMILLKHRHTMLLLHMLHFSCLVCIHLGLLMNMHAWIFLLGTAFEILTWSNVWSCVWRFYKYTRSTMFQICDMYM